MTSLPCDQPNEYWASLDVDVAANGAVGRSQQGDQGQGTAESTHGSAYFSLTSSGSSAKVLASRRRRSRRAGNSAGKSDHGGQQGWEPRVNVWGQSQCKADWRQSAQMHLQ